MTGTILVTGASGRMGRTLLQHWRDRDVIGLDRAGAGRNVDLGQGPEACASAFAGAETVVHLAADPDPGSPFERGGYGNTLATLTVGGVSPGGGAKADLCKLSLGRHPSMGLVGPDDVVRCLEACWRSPGACLGGSDRQPSCVSASGLLRSDGWSSRRLQ